MRLKRKKGATKEPLFSWDKKVFKVFTFTATSDSMVRSQTTSRNSIRSDPDSIRQPFCKLKFSLFWIVCLSFLWRPSKKLLFFFLSVLHKTKQNLNYFKFRTNKQCLIINRLLTRGRNVCIINPSMKY